MVALQRIILGAILLVSMQVLTQVPAVVAQPSDNQGAPSAAKPRDPAQIFATTCGWCHHKGGREAGKGPQLMGTSASDGEIIYRIKMGKAGYMPAFGTAFSEEEITALVSYIRNLKPR
jgi:mono/diheme cytochrome c family protein